MQMGLIGVDFGQTLCVTDTTIFEAFLHFLLRMTQRFGGVAHTNGGKLGKNKNDIIHP